ncbi:MAG TPA: GNAT family protein [Hyphomicrobiales bacterium]|nr:GNAT family protein [Hyphomicrobiales bacterium]
MQTDDPKRFGATVPGWTPPARPDGIRLAGRHAALEPLRADTHAAALYPAYAGQDQVLDYLPYGPFAAPGDYEAWVRGVEAQSDPQFLAIRNLDSGRWEGVASYLRIAPEAGSIEVGHINLSPALQRTRAGTEAMYLMMRWAFEAGYRRYEWKCDALNIPSRRAAERLGFSFEGVFRQAAVVTGRNRDTAWFAALDADWPALRAAFTAWLDPGSFDAEGRQIERLGALTAPIRVSAAPVLTG